MSQMFYFLPFVFFVEQREASENTVSGESLDEDTLSVVFWQKSPLLLLLGRVNFPPPQSRKATSKHHALAEPCLFSPFSQLLSTSLYFFPSQSHAVFVVPGPSAEILSSAISPLCL